MEDKEDTQSSGSAHLPPIPPTVLDSDEEAANLSLTVASKIPAKAEAQTTVEAPTRNTRLSTKAGRLRTSGSGGREDCWSDGATSSLINAWGGRFLELSRGNLKQKHWQEVADVVSSRDDYTRSPKTKTDVQCKNRIDTLKKKYKVEKSKICSDWPFFQPLDNLIGGGGNPRNSSTTSNYNGNKSSTKEKKKKARTKRSKMDLRFELQTCKKKRSEKKMIQRQLPEKPTLPPSSRPESTGYEDGLREMVKAVVKVSEIYERVERSKLEQIAEMEKQRMKFTREMELQRMRFFMKSQLELTQLSLNQNFNCRKRGRTSSDEEDRDVGDNELAHATASAAGDSNSNSNSNNNSNTDSNSNNKSTDSKNRI